MYLLTLLLFFVFIIGSILIILYKNSLLQSFMNIYGSNFIELSPDEMDCEINFDWDDCGVFLKN